MSSKAVGCVIIVLLIFGNIILYRCNTRKSSFMCCFDRTGHEPSVSYQEEVAVKEGRSYDSNKNTNIENQKPVSRLIYKKGKVFIQQETNTRQSIEGQHQPVIVGATSRTVRKDIPHKSTLSPQDGSLLELLQRTATKTAASPYPAVTVVILDNIYIEMFNNFVESAMRVGIKNLLPVTLSKESHEHLTKEGYANYYCDKLESISKSESKFSSLEFHRKGTMKFEVSLEILKLNYSVFLTDLDVYFIKNPFPYFNCSSCDFEVQRDEPEGRPSLLCVGINFFRPHKNTVQFLKSLVNCLNSDYKKWDQWEFSKFAPKEAKSNRLRYRELPFRLFPTGAYPFPELYADPLKLQSMVIYHNNWITNYRPKRYRAKELGIWLVDTDGYYSDPNRNYLTYSNPLIEYTNAEVTNLLKAFMISRALNRTLILPDFHCPKDKHKLCSLADITNIEKFDQAFEGKYREHRFLDHHKVPDAKKTLSNVYFVHNSSVKIPDNMFNGKHMIKLNISTHIKLNDFISLLSEFKNETVLFLRDVYFNISDLDEESLTIK